MNLLLLPRDLACLQALLAGEPREVAIAGRQAQHLAQVLRASPGQNVRVGLCDGPRGTATILALDARQARLAVRLDPSDRPARPPVDLVLGIPRPLQLRRVVQHAAALGVDRLVLLRTRWVEQSYLGSKVLDLEVLAEEARLGLEQAGSTWQPRLAIEPRFLPFVEDRMPALLAEEPRARGLVCVPGAPALAERFASDPGLRAAIAEGRVMAAIGPERGFTDHEVARFEERGFVPVGLGERILRVETAVPALLGQLDALRTWGRALGAAAGGGGTGG